MGYMAILLLVKIKVTIKAMAKLQAISHKDFLLTASAIFDKSSGSCMLEKVNAARVVILITNS
jgi:hypothetical protein